MQKHAHTSKRVTTAQHPAPKILRLPDPQVMKDIERIALAERRITPEQVEYLTSQEVTEVLLANL